MEDIKKLGLVSLEASELQTRGGIEYKDWLKVAALIESFFTFFTTYIPELVKGFNAGFKRD